MQELLPEQSFLIINAVVGAKLMKTNVEKDEKC